MPKLVTTKRVIALVLSIVLPLTIIFFGMITHWRYVSVEDGTNEFLYGFPLAFMCRGWHTSLSFQIFVSELVFNFLVYFTFLSTVIWLVDNYLKPIIVHKYLKFGLYSIAILTMSFYGFLFSNPNNIFKIKRDFNYSEIRSGVKFFWQKDKR